jgi:alpha-1,3-glucosyltransferase
MKDWYFEATSVWTLDYPPFFAYFEYLLAQVQSFFVPGSMAIAANPTESSYLLTMRVSVILTDLLYYYACLRMTRALNKTTGFLCALYVNWGLVLIDNMHF